MKVEGLNNWNMSIAFCLKALVGMYFLYIYTEFYGDGTLSADAGDFMSESKVLNGVFYKSPIDYFHFLSGIGDTQELQLKFLVDTRHWDAGAQSLINDNKNILRIHSLIHFFSFNNPFIHVLVLCFLSLVGMRQFLIGLIDRSKLNVNVQFWILILIPSVLFWTSGLLKEPLLILGLGVLWRGILGKDPRLKKVIFISLGILLLVGFKPYVLASIVPALLFFGFYNVLPRAKIIGSILILSIISTSLLFIFSTKRDEVVHLITRKQQDFENIGKGGIYAWNGNGFYYFKPNQLDDLTIKDNHITLKKELKVVLVDVGGMESPLPYRLKNDGESYQIYFMRKESDGYIDIPSINDSFQQLVFNVPTAVRNCLFRPFITDPGSWLKYPAVAEIWILFGFLLFSIFKRRKLESSELALLIAILIFIFILATIIGLTTPVLGAIVRYRLPILIGIAIISIIIIDPKKKLSS